MLYGLTKDFFGKLSSDYVFWIREGPGLEYIQTVTSIKRQALNRSNCNTAGPRPHTNRTPHNKFVLLYICQANQSVSDITTISDPDELSLTEELITETLGNIF